MLVGLISDTHDLLRPELAEALDDVERIIHCGDVCNEGLLKRIEEIAPVTAVRGNCDRGPWASSLPVHDTFEIEGVTIHAVHDLMQLEIEPRAAGVDLVLSGHTHRPAEEIRNGCSFVNPGSCGPRRFRLPISWAVLRVEQGRFEIEFRELKG